MNLLSIQNEAKLSFLNALCISHNRCRILLNWLPLPNVAGFNKVFSEESFFDTDLEDDFKVFTQTDIYG